MREPHIHISRANVISRQDLTTKANKPLVRFRIAVNPGRYDQNHQWQDGTSQFYDVTIFDHTERYEGIQKGTHIAVDGRLELETYKAKDGTDRQSWRIIGADITLVPDAPRQPQDTYGDMGGGYDGPSF